MGAPKRPCSQCFLPGDHQSTRRFLARPSGVALSGDRFVLALAIDVSREGSLNFGAINASTAFALATERSKLT